MMVGFILNQSKAKSLTAQIKDAEQQVSNRQRQVKIRAVTLVSNVHQQMTAPATLLLASGIGFIIGELTSQNRRLPAKDENNHSAEITPLRVALNLLTSVRTVYTALPLAWMIKSFYQPTTTSQHHVSKVRPARKTRSSHPNVLRRPRA